MPLFQPGLQFYANKVNLLPVKMAVWRIKTQNVYARVKPESVCQASIRTNYKINQPFQNQSVCILALIQTNV